jgi:hypothetical protein
VPIGSVTLRSQCSRRSPKSTLRIRPAALRVASLTSTSPPGATAHRRAATFTVRPYQSPSRSTASPLCTPTRIAGKVGSDSSAATIRSASRTAAAGSSHLSMIPSPSAFTSSPE